MAKRKRATVIVLKDGKVLLVKDRGVRAFSLPGGKIEKGESTVEAATRELYEETGIETKKAVRLKECDYESKFNYHKVCFIEAKNYEINLNKSELKDYMWWDTHAELAMYNHVKIVISKFKRSGYYQNNIQKKE